MGYDINVVEKEFCKELPSQKIIIRSVTYLSRCKCESSQSPRRDRQVGEESKCGLQFVNCLLVFSAAMRVERRELR